MDKCDKCKNMARFTVTGYGAARYLCAHHAAEIAERIGDRAGYEKFKELEKGDRLAVSA